MARRSAPSPASAAAPAKRATRRGAGMRHIAPAAAAAARPALRKRGLAVAGVIADWHRIVGAFLAGATAPEKLVAGRSLPEGGRDAGVLHLRVGSPALAPEIAHLAPQIIEKVNGYFGYRAVARLHILHAPVSRPDTRPENRQVAAPPPEAAPAESEAVRRQTAGIEDDGLRDALQRLGEAVAARQGRG
ncbi:MAG: DciA family protein [Rhodospirillaceae bacterium]|nr:DciA family protein [Rhodospirillaceae bacterium]